MATHGMAAPPSSVKSKTIDATLNGLSIRIDASTGAILRFAYPGPGVLLEAPPERAGLVDLAYPLDDFEPLRLAPRFSSGARITVAPQRVTIAWDAIGPSRKRAIDGHVSGRVEIEAADDGRSVLLRCQIDNQSPRPVRQVLFPDLVGLVASGGEDHTEFRTAGSLSRPFRELSLDGRDRFYGTDTSFAQYRSGSLQDPMVLRWMDLGSLRGGLSLFPRRWGWDARVTILLNRSERTGRLRLMCMHDQRIEPNSRWSSGPFVLTPHRHGWAKGIEPYRRWVRSHVQRKYALPRHVRRGLGFRSVWMCQNQPTDPGDANWRFADLLPLAREAKAHGLTEMVVWTWQRGFRLPLPGPYPHLGSEQEWIDAIKQCNAIGVNVSPFISVLQAERTTAPRYGLAVKPDSSGWTYHTEFIPRFNPPYASAMASVQVDTRNLRWQRDVLASCRHLIDQGIPSLCWDQYWSVPQTPNLNTLTDKIRALAKQRDPQSTFSGEELKNMEIDCNYLDYTWNWPPDWRHYRPLQALVSVLPAPRINWNINTSVDDVKRGFADNLYLNIWPRKPDGTNGSDWIAKHAQLSAALKQCAGLRQQFLSYFTGGTLVGACLLTEPLRDVHASGYVLGERALLILINGQQNERAIRVACDLRPWLPAAAAGPCMARTYDGRGRSVGLTQIDSGVWKAETPRLKHLEMVLVEFTPE